MLVKKLKTEIDMEILRKIPSLLLLLVLAFCAACGSDENLIKKEESHNDVREFECNMEHGQSDGSRTYFESENQSYMAKWCKEDKIALCFDGSEVGKEFSLKSGENSTSAIFYGPVPDNFKEVTAIYPSDIFVKRTSTSVEINMPESFHYDAQKILNGIMPMYAHSTNGVLNFYNLMAVLKISVKGDGLLRSITLRSIDGYGLSGNGQIILDENRIPLMTFFKNESPITINLGSVFLSEEILDLYIPIPAMKYDNGLKIDFNFEGSTETRELKKTLEFERSVLRSVKPYEIKAPFDFNKYQSKNDELWYTANYKQSATKDIESELGIRSNSYSSNYHLGVITAKSDILKIGGPVFKSPASVQAIRLPQSLKEIGMGAFKGTSIESLEAPENLRSIGTDAFMNCSRLKRVVLNDGLESLDAEVFGSCTNLEYVYIPKSVAIICFYMFIHSTENLDHWDGDCSLIDDDRHALYSNSGYGMVNDNPTMIDAIAGCNLTEYSIPKRALYTQNYAFSGCKKLRKITIHESFRSFGLEFFSVLPALETIVCHGPTPPQFDSDEVFSSTSLKEIRVPEESLELYKNARGWEKFADKIKPL